MGSHSRAVGNDSQINVPHKSDVFRTYLFEQDDWYRDLVDHSRDLLCVHDLEGRLLACNPATARVLGYSVEELLKIPMRELVFPEGRDQFDTYLRQIAETGEASGVLAVVSRSGERRLWEYHNTLRTEGVAVPVARGIAHDVTEQRRAEHRLQETTKKLIEAAVSRELAWEESELFRTLVDQSKDAIELLDLETLRFLDCNQTACIALGYSRQELLKLRISDIVPGFNEQTQAEHRERLQRIGSMTLESEHRRKDGTTFPVEVALKLVRMNRDYVVAVARDITERKRNEQALRDAMEELGQAKEKLSEERIYLEEEIDTQMGFGEIVGQSKALKHVLTQVTTVSASDATVLVEGETGTGKELIARAIHRLSSRRGGSFIKMNCAALPSGLLESELFGHEKGAFTGAVERKIGRLELADRGTLFLDEIGEIPVSMQPKLLRVLQDQEFERLGGTRTLRVDFRLVVATNRDLWDSVKRGEFRSDLYYRLKVFPLTVPPLRERREDIPALVEHFVRIYSARMKKSITSIPKRTMEMLERWDWPGNIRELENFVERSVILTEGSVLRAPLRELSRPSITTTPLTLEEAQKEHILRVLRESGGQLGGPTGAAARLGLKRTTLQSKLKQMGIEWKRQR